MSTSPDAPADVTDEPGPAAPEPVTPGTAAGGVPAARRRALVLVTVALTVVMLAADQLTKWWAESTLELGGTPVPLVGELLQLRLIYNDGAALGLASGMTWLLTIVVVGVVVAIVRLIGRLGSRGWAVALGLLLGGALGNLGDRLFREPGFGRGWVVDFIDYAGFFVGNVADVAIVVAAVMIGVLSVLGVGVDGRRHTDEDAAAAKAGDVAADGDDAGGTADAGDGAPR